MLVFCQSVNTTHRLARLLQICCSLRAKALVKGEEAEEEEVTEDEVVEPRASSETVAEFSSSLTPKERSKMLRSFAKGKVRCLVCPSERSEVLTDLEFECSRFRRGGAGHRRSGRHGGGELHGALASADLYPSGGTHRAGRQGLRGLGEVSS